MSSRSDRSTLASLLPDQGTYLAASAGIGHLAAWFVLTLRAFGVRLATARQDAVARLELSSMSDRELSDLGLTRGQISQVFAPSYARFEDATLIQEGKR